MDKFIIEGGRKLFGQVEIQSAKNSVLPLLAASILTDEQVTIRNVPNISDADNMLKILEELGCSIEKNGNDVVIDSQNAVSHEIPARLTKELRSSVFMLGPVLTRFHKAKISYPGGCDIGLRPIDLHLSGLKKLGVKITEENGFVLCEADELKGAEITLDFPSVGATENIILASVCANGQTVVRNAAKEPEIVDLTDFLNRSGAKIRGGGTDVIYIEGVKKISGIDFFPMKDRIEAGTFLIACASCGGEIEVLGLNYENLAALLDKLVENGCKIHKKRDKIVLKSSGNLFAAKRIETTPFPGFPTDLQAQYCALCTKAVGTSVIVENLFETRYKYVGELKRMGADITVLDRNAVVRGVNALHGAAVRAGDLRGGAALVLAGLTAEGETTVSDLWHIDRGYDSFDRKLRLLGANIERKSFNG